MDQFNSDRSAADAARLLSAANATRELYEQSTAFQLYQFYENQRRLIDLVAPLYDAWRRVSVEQPLLFEQIKLALQGNLAAAHMLDVVRTTDLHKYPIPDVISRLSQPAFIDPLREVFREAWQQYQRGELDVDAEVADALADGGHGRVINFKQWRKAIMLLLTIYPLLKDCHDDALLDRRFDGIEKQLAREAQEKDHPDYFFTATGVNLREGPSTATKKLRVLEPRTILIRLGTAGDWIFVELHEDRSQRGWVYRGYVEDLD